MVAVGDGEACAQDHDKGRDQVVHCKTLTYGSGYHAYPVAWASTHVHTSRVPRVALGTAVQVGTNGTGEHRPWMMVRQWQGWGECMGQMQGAQMHSTLPS